MKVRFELNDEKDLQGQKSDGRTTLARESSALIVVTMVDLPGKEPSLQSPSKDQ